MIWESPPFPDSRRTVRGDVDRTYGPGFTEPLRAALTGIADPAIPGPFGRAKFIPVTHAASAPRAEVGRSTGLLDGTAWRAARPPVLDTASAAYDGRPVLSAST